MNITIDQAQGAVPVTILGIDGELDGSNYLEVVDQAQQLYQQGSRYMLIDLSKTPYMSSAGLVALHKIALMLQGGRPEDPDTGWEAFRSMGRDRDSGVNQRVKLINPQPPVAKLLEMTGMKRYFDVFIERQAAVNSFA